MTRRWLQPFLLTFLLASGLVLGLAAPAAAQRALLLEEQASFCAMVQALSPTRPSGPAERVYTFTTRIPFGWDSTRLAPEAHQAIDTLAEVLQDAAMANKVLRIEGHTDSTGSDAYNQRLSYRWAVAVQQYLRAAHGHAPSRLPVVGRGKADIYDPAHPYDPSNRRVEFMNRTDSPGRQ